MEMTSFFDAVQNHPELEGIGIDTCQEGKTSVIVKYTKNDLMTKLPVEAIEESEWGILEDVLTGQREPQVLQHMTRVVGYFSRVENWNKSKVGELKDRQKGNYAVVN
ncbi:MAG: anaerobic ribonucleoside-triphosphate reductase [Planctomycetes bacterium]|nr:anaerobic ribonucleoside-triphosphate reductase [Planctomycetota bacterium]